MAFKLSTLLSGIGYFQTVISWISLKRPIEAMCRCSEKWAVEFTEAAAASHRLSFAPSIS